MKRYSTDLCNHALNEFGFLFDLGFEPRNEVTDSTFYITYTVSDGRVITVCSFLPRYEYDVTLRRTFNSESYHLDELISATAPEWNIETDWTWAHSDPKEFSRRISYSANLLRRFGQPFFDRDESIWPVMQQRRVAYSAAQELIRRRSQSKTAFEEQRWSEAIQIYESLPCSLTPLEMKRLTIAKKHQA
jgi:hypothetical protein